ncbi:MAG TPA: epoxyqueuosine reductase QueH [Clostridiales bacterium]|nr:epoxyqueuosine reductase QueH [Clostridiales bacterium]
MNYQLELDKIIKDIEENQKRPKLLIHSCCAPCSSYVLEYLSNYFEITLYYYNPNIYPENEYNTRVEEQKNIIDRILLSSKVDFIQGEYNPQEYYDVIRGYENDDEGGERCFACYKLRLTQAAKLAKELQFDYFATTLSISPHKNALKINEIGEQIAIEYGIQHLPSDFKKKNGYKRSIELSKLYSLYRQDYCGCIYSQINKNKQ